ncbi:MAG: hypothetical protein EZS28_007812 [Streblomastix strix]|uniref:Piwi domain-containing protein n=1 Tax=Streblomastix strix TaxID=222440 RepID=A0A5J4WPP3_9EUKA|nr:MAG: hypothetical protein EZS28_007812 [Streblomastix strix]
MRGNDFADEFEKKFGQEYKNAQIVLFVLPDRDEVRYRKLKYLTETWRTRPTQAILGKNFAQVNMSVLTGLWMQMVQKMGGICWAVPPYEWSGKDKAKSSLEDGGIMCISVNVSRSSPRKEGTVALVSSYNHELTLYHQRTKRMEQRKEIVEKDFDVFVQEALEQYKSYNSGYLPSFVFCYRDGLGDSMLENAIKMEYRQLTDKMKAQDTQTLKYRPRHAFIVVDKKTNHRFFEAQQSNRRNPPPGTVVDKEIVSDALYDFFLIPQDVHQDTTSVPSRFIVLKDHTNLTQAQLEDFTNSLCYIYCNYFGSIASPLPIHMAHKLSMHTQEVLQGQVAKLLNTTFYI